MHTPAKRDLIAEFTSGCRKEGILPMLYCTTLDWSDPRFENDFPAYLQYLRDSIEILCTRYGPIGGFWFERMAFGMFVHWGLYSQIGRGEWAKNKPEDPDGRVHAPDADLHRQGLQSP